MAKNIVESFFDLLPIMEAWEWQLLFDVELLCTEESLWEALTTQVCTIASDGSAIDGKGSFGWVISGGAGDILAESKGPVHGATVTLFRAEGYGILSVLRFLLGMSKVHGGEPGNKETNQSPQDEEPRLGTLHQRIRHHQTHVAVDNDPPETNRIRLRQHHMVCDNQSIVNKINEISKYVTMYPNSTMALEYDVSAEIRTAMRLLGTSHPVLEHIKGHQDAKKPWNELTRSAQLNCHADKLAEQFLKEFPDTDKTMVPLLPTSGCQLQMTGGTVTYDLKLKLTHARTVPPSAPKDV